MGRVGLQQVRLRLGPEGTPELPTRKATRAHKVLHHVHVGTDLKDSEAGPVLVDEGQWDFASCLFRLSRSDPAPIDRAGEVPLQQPPGRHHTQGGAERQGDHPQQMPPKAIGAKITAIGWRPCRSPCAASAEALQQLAHAIDRATPTTPHSHWASQVLQHGGQKGQHQAQAEAQVKG